MFIQNYQTQSRAVQSTQPFWQKIAECFENTNIRYVSIPDENVLIDTLTTLPKPDLFLFDFSSEAINDYELLLQKFSYLIDRPYVIISCDPKWFFKEHANTVFLPVWYYDVYYTNLKNKQISFTSNKKYLVSCLNRAVKIPRIYNLVKMHKFRLLENPDLLLTFKPYDVYINDSTIPPNDDRRIIYPQDVDWSILENNFKIKGIDNSIDLVNDIRHTYTFLFNDLPINPLGEDLSSILDDHTINHPAYLDTFANIITESITYNIFYTEKTFKALAAGMPFWLQGGTNSSLYLDLFGFDTYSDIDLFDYTQYDTESNFIDRTDKIISRASAVLKEKNFIDISKRQLVNQEMFFSDKTYNLFFQHLLGKIKKIIS